MNIKDVVIIGAGPAGISAAIQLKRYGIEPTLLEKEEIGGLLKNANLVENYPGFPNGVPGPELVKLFKKQLENAQIKVHFEKVLKLHYKNGLFSIKTNQKKITCHIIVIASGTKPRKLSNLNITAEIKNHIYYEIYPLIQVKNKKITIIGAGDASFDYALNLSKQNKVTILNRGEEVKCLPLLWKRTMETKNITYLQTTNIENIKLHNKGLTLTCHNNAKKWEMHVSYLVVAIGREPCLDFLNKTLIKDLERLQKLKILYMIGDVKNGIYRQTAIAIGDGIKAAMEIYKKLKEEKL